MRYPFMGRSGRTAAMMNGWVAIRSRDGLDRTPSTVPIRGGLSRCAHLATPTSFRPWRCSSRWPVRPRPPESISLRVRKSRSVAHKTRWPTTRSFVKLNAIAIARLKGSRGATGATGPAGAAGAAGGAGPAGPAGATGRAGATGSIGSTGPAGTAIKLAGYAKTDDQTLPDDASFHTIWTMHITVQSNQLFIVTGAIGGASTPGCSGGNQLTEQVTVDGSPAANPGAFLTFAPGAHTVSYDVRGDCPGSPANVPGQEAILIPFTLP
jgi:hypothetical protein